MSRPQRIRPPSVAGLFYPSGAAALERQVDAMLSAAAPGERAGCVRVLVSPHAGYTYSGAVAAAGYRTAARADVRTVVVVGPSHVEYFDFSSVFDGDGYETPLGVIPVDRALADRVCSGRDTVRASHHGHSRRGLHRGEHSLEVQMPFLQRAFHGVRVVPIVMGEQSWANCRDLGEALAGVVGEDVMIVASSDLSHFHDAGRAAALDAAFCSVLSTLRPRDVHDAVAGRRCEACGAGPVVAALVAVEGLAGKEYHELARAHSGQVTGDDSSVVGYLSAAVAAPLAS